MGCDIHAHVEVFLDNEWFHWDKLEITRRYALFSRMAEVRGDGPAIAIPRGLPKDISKVTQLYRDQWDAHTESWLRREEVVQLLREFGYLMGTGWEEIVEPVKDARLVFWFDS